MKIGFLGSNCNPVSSRCLERILADGSFDVLAGIEKKGRLGFLRTMMNGIKRYGPMLWFPKVTRYALRCILGSLLVFSGRAGMESMTRLVKRYGIECFECKDVNGRATREKLAAFGPDVVVLGSFSQILKRDVLSIPSMACINVHPSLLPAYRGPTPLYWMLKNGERTGGVTVHFVDEGIDTGDIIMQESFPIRPATNESDLLQTSAGVGADLLLATLHLIRSGQVLRYKQNSDLASYLSFPRLERINSMKLAEKA